MFIVKTNQLRQVMTQRKIDKQQKKRVKENQQNPPDYINDDTSAQPSGTSVKTTE